MLLLATWWQKIPFSFAAGIRALGNDGIGLTHGEDELLHIDDLYAEINGHEEEVVEEIQDITLGIATEGYNGRVYDILESEDVNVRSIGNTPEDPAALPMIEDMPNNMDEVQKKYAPVALETKQQKDVFKKDETGLFRVVIEYKKGKKDKVLQLLSGSNPSSQSASLQNEIPSLHMLAAHVTRKQLRKLKRNPNVELVAPDVKLVLISSQEEIDISFNETLTSQRRSLADYVTYGHNMVNAGKIQIQGKGIKVCVLDQGYDYNHPDLPSNVEWVTPQSIDSANNICCPWETCNKKYCSGHGTHVSGTIAAKSNSLGVVGVAPKVDLVEGAYLDYTTHASNFVSLIVDCINKGAKVVNMSFGSPTYNDVYDRAFKNIVKSDNVLLIASAGNDGEKATKYNPNYPASYDSVISVANVDSRGRRHTSSSQNNPDISGPGTDIRSTAPGGGYAKKTGTSMAAPHVAGTTALAWSAMPWLSASQMKNHLLSHASYIGNQAHTGRGLVDPGFFPIAVKQSGKCLDHRGLTSHGRIHLWDCHSGMQQMWTYDKVNNFLVTSTGLCLDYNLRSGLSVYPCVRNTNQKFYYNSAQHTFKAHGKCLDAHDSYLYQNGGFVFMGGCHYRPDQQWYIGSELHSKVNLCQHSTCNAGGQFWASFGDWRTMPSQIGNDELSRALVYKNVYFEYYQHTNFGGWHLMFGPWVNLWMGGHNDAVSSFKIRLIPEGKVRLCRHSNCAGGDHYASVGDWRTMPSSVGNDQLTRVQIPRGLKFTYYEHGNFGGWSGTFGSCNNGINLYMGGHNDAVSSFRVRTCY